MVLRRSAAVQRTNMSPIPPKFVPRPTLFRRLMYILYISVLCTIAILSFEWVKEQRADIPSGKWVTLFIGDGISVQLNLHTFDKHSKQDAFTVWVREDRQKPFSSGLVIGKTVLSRITVNCKENTVTVHEQRSFDDVLDRLMVSEKEVVYSTPDEVIVAVTHLTMCSASEFKNSLPPEKSEKDLTYVKFTF